MSDSNLRLLERLAELLRRDRSGEAELVEVLGEVDARHLYLDQAYSSMFEYCVRELRFAEGVAYKRIAVARAARRHPEILAALASGEIHLTGACLIAPHLVGGAGAGADAEDGGGAVGMGSAEAGTVREWLALARHATVREIKQRIADRKPRSTPSTFIRRLTKGSGSECVGARGCGSDLAGRLDSDRSESRRPTPGSGEVEPLRGGLSIRNAPSTETDLERSRTRCEPLGTGRYAIRFVVEDQVYGQLEELRALMRHSIPDGDLGNILTQAIGVLLDRVRKQKFGIGIKSANTHTNTTNKSAAAAAAGSPGVGPRRPDKRMRSESPSRHIPVSIRRAVWARDGGRCRFLSRSGKFCGARDCLEFHHGVPWARRREHSIENIELRCRAHNQYEAIADFGPERMVRYQRDGRSLNQ
jgi:hypothetical protein